MAFNNTQCNFDLCDVATTSFYAYRPSLGQNAALLAIFAVSFVGFVAEGLWYRTWGFLIAMGLGTLSTKIHLPNFLLLIAVFAQYTLSGLCLWARTFILMFTYFYIAEILGYVGRVMSYNNPWDMNAFLIQVCIYSFKKKKKYLFYVAFFLTKVPKTPFFS